jgi:hypothetical protein
VNILLGTAEKRECNGKRCAAPTGIVIGEAAVAGPAVTNDGAGGGLVLHSGLLESRTVLEEQVVESKEFTSFSYESVPDERAWWTDSPNLEGSFRDRRWGRPIMQVHVPLPSPHGFLRDSDDVKKLLKGPENVHELKLTIVMAVQWIGAETAMCA